MITKAKANEIRRRLELHSGRPVSPNKGNRKTVKTNEARRKDMQELVIELIKLARLWREEKDTGSVIEDRGYNRARTECADQVQDLLEAALTRLLQEAFVQNTNKPNNEAQEDDDIQ